MSIEMRKAGCSSSQSKIHLRALRVLAALLLLVYLAWNLYWLSQTLVPPSLFKSLTGLPCPTTGCTRSLDALLRGKFLESLRYNLMTMPIAALFCISIAYPLFRWSRGDRATIPNWVATGWLIVLGFSWLAKLLGDRLYW